MTLDQDYTSAELLSRYQAGEPAAADQLFERYLDRLTSLARARLSQRLASRIDPEDIVQSAWRTFFVRARDDRFALQRSGDLWRLLVSMTMHKLYGQVRRHSADVRAVARDQSLVSEAGIELPIPDRQPTPDEAVTLAEVIESCMTELDPTERRLLELRLQGWQLEEIAGELACSERTVRRKLSDIRIRLAMRLEVDVDGRPR